MNLKFVTLRSETQEDGVFRTLQHYNRAIRCMVLIKEIQFVTNPKTTKIEMDIPVF